MVLAVYGKHPAKGDFLEHGIPAALKPALEGWLDAVLGQARGDLGPAWEQVWRDAPVLRFWIGEAIWGQPVAGVMATSQDRVGRRFPLVMLCAGADAARLPAPTIGDDGGWYDALAAQLVARLATQDLAVPGDLLRGAAVPGDLAAPEPGPDSFWAVRPGASTASLLADIALTDHRRAAAGRSYWWVAGQDAPEPAAPPEPAPEAWHAVLAETPPEDLPEDLPADRTADPPVDPTADLPGSGTETAPEAETAVPDLTDAEPEPELESQPDAAPEAPAVSAVPDAWDLPEDDDSPFASGGGLSLFAAPLAADPSIRAQAVSVVAAPVAPLQPARRLLCSQVWVGSGLPSGQVLAWFLRGVSADA